MSKGINNFMPIDVDYMAPIIESGDSVYVERKKKFELNIFDIVLIRRNNSYIPVRYIYKLDNNFILKGDTLNEVYELSTEDILGKISLIKKKNLYLKIEDMYAFQSRLYFKSVREIYKECKKRNSIFLKGFILNLYYEKKVPKRVYADCDILVVPREFSDIQKYFLQQSYVPDNSSLRVSTTLPEISFVKKLDNFPIIFDLHQEPVFLMTQFDVAHTLYSRELLDQMTEEFINSKRSININSLECDILAPHHLIVYLALHFFHHNYH